MGGTLTKSVNGGTPKATKGLSKRQPEHRLPKPRMTKCPPLRKTLYQKTTMEERAEPLDSDKEPAVAVAEDAEPKDDWDMLDTGPSPQSH